MPVPECLGFRCLQGKKQNFQFESPKMKLHEFVRVPRVSDWARRAVQISKDEAPTPLLTAGLLFIFLHLLCVHLITLKIHSVCQTPLNFRTEDVARSSEQQQEQGYSHDNPFLFA